MNMNIRYESNKCKSPYNSCWPCLKSEATDKGFFQNIFSINTN